MKTFARLLVLVLAAAVTACGSDKSSQPSTKAEVPAMPGQTQATTPTTSDDSSAPAKQGTNSGTSGATTPSGKSGSTQPKSAAPLPSTKPGRSGRTYLFVV